MNRKYLVARAINDAWEKSLCNLINRRVLAIICYKIYSLDFGLGFVRYCVLVLEVWFRKRISRYLPCDGMLFYKNPQKYTKYVKLFRFG